MYALRLAVAGASRAGIVVVTLRHAPHLRWFGVEENKRLLSWTNGVHVKGFILWMQTDSGVGSPDSAGTNCCKVGGHQGKPETLTFSQRSVKTSSAGIEWFFN